MEDINWGYFPEPYRDELPLYFSKALEHFRTEEGLGMLNVLLESARRMTTGQEMPEIDGGKAEALMRSVSDTNEWEFRAVVALTKHLKKATDASLEETRGEMALLENLKRLHERAWELEPALPKNSTVSEAVAVLKRHGVPLGISEEVLDMEFEVPPENWRDEE